MVHQQQEVIEKLGKLSSAGAAGPPILMSSAALKKQHLEAVVHEDETRTAAAAHKTLELAGDKFYMITCGKAGFQNSRYVNF